MKAVVLKEKGHPINNFELMDFEKPTPGPKDLLVKIYSTALNPVDFKMAHYGFMIKKFPIILGCDMSGVVEAVGSEVQKFKEGDQVFGFTELGTPGAGSFAEYCLIPEELAFHKTPQMTHDECCTFGVGLLTSSLGIFQELQIPLPSENKQSQYENKFILVWGASSSVGSYAVQMAQLAGFKVIATASKRNFDAIKSCGAVQVFDYTSSDVVDQIKSYTGGNLHYAFDPIATDETIKMTTDCLSKEGDCLVSGTSPCKIQLAPNVKYTNVLLGAMHSTPRSRESCKRFVPEFSDLIASGKIRPNSIEKLEGLSNIKKGLELLQENKVGGKKVVVSVSQ